MRRPLPASPVYIRFFESIAIMCARMNSPAWRPGLPKRSRMESRGEEMTLVLRILLPCRNLCRYHVGLARSSLRRH